MKIMDTGEEGFSSAPGLPTVASEKPSSPLLWGHYDFVKIAWFKRAGERMFPKRRILDPKPRRVKGPKSATERSHDGGASVASAICRFPA